VHLLFLAVALCCGLTTGLPPSAIRPRSLRYRRRSRQLGWKRRHSDRGHPTTAVVLVTGDQFTTIGGTLQTKDAICCAPSGW
jgi:hypothetical protein